MSKFMVASDIHGSFTGVGTLLERFSDEKADRLILLGDLYYHGPRNPLPAEYDAQKTADLLNSVKENLIVVRGNCDADVDLCISDFTFQTITSFRLSGKTFSSLTDIYILLTVCRLCSKKAISFFRSYSYTHAQKRRRYFPRKSRIDRTP